MRVVIALCAVLAAACGQRVVVADLPAASPAEAVPLVRALWRVPDGPEPRGPQSAMVCAGLGGEDVPGSVLLKEVKRGALGLAAVQVTPAGARVDDATVAPLVDGGWRPEDLDDGALAPLQALASERRALTAAFVAGCKSDAPPNRAFLVLDAPTPWTVIAPVVEALGRAGYVHLYVPVDASGGRFALPADAAFTGDSPRAALAAGGPITLDGDDLDVEALTGALAGRDGARALLFAVDVADGATAGEVIEVAAAARAADWTTVPLGSGGDGAWTPDAAEHPIGRTVPAVRIAWATAAPPVPAAPPLATAPSAPDVQPPLVDPGPHETRVVGFVAAEDVEGVLAEAADAAYACAEEGSSPEGYVSLIITAGGDGAVSAVEVRADTVGDDALRDCLVAHAEALTFPAPGSLGDLPGMPGVTLSQFTQIWHAWVFPRPDQTGSR